MKYEELKTELETNYQSFISDIEETRLQLEQLKANCEQAETELKEMYDKGTYSDQELAQKFANTEMLKRNVETKEKEYEEKKNAPFLTDETIMQYIDELREDYNKEGKTVLNKIIDECEVLNNEIQNLSDIEIEGEKGATLLMRYSELTDSKLSTLTNNILKNQIIGGAHPTSFKKWEIENFIKKIKNRFEHIKSYIR